MRPVILSVVLPLAFLLVCPVLPVTLAHRRSVQRWFHLCRTRMARHTRHLCMRAPGELERRRPAPSVTCLRHTDVQGGIQIRGEVCRTESSLRYPCGPYRT